MVDIMANENLLSDCNFEIFIYPKLISKIKLQSKFQELDKIATEKGYRVIFKYYKEETRRKIIFEVGFDICDENGKTVSVPLTAHTKFYDLGELISYPYGACYKKRTQKIDLIEDEKELCEDCQIFIDYLNS